MKIPHRKAEQEKNRDEAFSRLLEKIQNEANAEIQKIQNQTKKKLEEIEIETEKMAEEVKKKELEKENSRIDFLKKRTETEFQQEAKKIEIQTREKLIDEVFAKVEIKINEFRKNEKYEDYLERTLRKSIKNMREKQTKIIIDKKDEKIFKKIAEKISKSDNVECLISESAIKTAGGFILTDSKERVRINHTFENLLESSREKIRTKINELLFG